MQSSAKKQMNQSENPIKDHLLRPNQVADRLNVCVKTVYRLISDGHFRAIKARGSLRVFESSLTDYIDRQAALFALETGLLEETMPNIMTPVDRRP